MQHKISGTHIQASTKMLFFVYSVVLALTCLFQNKVIIFPAHYLFVFVIGNVLLCFYLFLAGGAKPKYYIPIHLFLWMFLLYEGYSYLFYSAALIFIAASIYYMRRNSIQPWVTRLYYIVASASIVLAFALNPAILFAVCTLYTIVMVLHADLTTMQKWNVIILGLLHSLAIAACASSFLFPFQQNTIFTLPTSFLIFVLYVASASIHRVVFRLLYAESIIFLCMISLLFGYSIASYKWVYSGSSSPFALCLTGSLVLFVMAFAACFNIQKVLRAKDGILESGLNDWFVKKWEDALSQQEKELSWSGFDSKLSPVIPNDGIKIMYNHKVIYTSGVFLEPGFKSGKSLYAGEVLLVLHRTDTHQSFTPGHYYTAYALARYLLNKLNQWEEMSKIKLLDAEGSGNFSKELSFRKEVTYYLHDNILQNIIATKNIVATLPTEQPALKELAVETLADLNTSIRSQMHEIYPSTLADLSFERNIHILLDEMRKRYGKIPNPHIQYEIFEQMDEQSAYLFYRTLQELLANTCKYAEANHIWIHLYTADHWIMEVKEDGRPIVQEDMEVKIKHLGISSLKHQAGSLGGAFEWAQHDDYKLFTLTLPRRTHEGTVI
ncbi:sensor histidine kinase [Paenibacillus sp. CN-4]|uniref:sensor histidine kinase n=1 Tax=Paenibacillus nanchangensis TaxID=3348343 RepID=UPI00397D42A6